MLPLWTKISIDSLDRSLYYLLNFSNFMTAHIGPLGPFTFDMTPKLDGFEVFCEQIVHYHIDVNLSVQNTIF